MQVPSTSLLLALDNGEEKAVLSELAAFSISDIGALRDDLDALFEKHATATMVPTRPLNWIQCLILLSCQKKRELKQTLTKLRERYRCDDWVMGRILIPLLNRFAWPLEESLAEYSLPKTYPHSWGIAFQLFEAGRVERPEAAGWLNWMPDGFSSRTKAHGNCGITTLENEPLLLAAVEDFFRSPVAGAIPSVYASSNRELVGTGDKPPKRSELQRDKDWSHYSQNCVGVALYGLATRGHYEINKVQELIFGALQSVTKTPAARWLTGLVDLVCDDDDIQRFDIEQLVSHDNKVVAKWAARKLPG